MHTSDDMDHDSALLSTLTGVLLLGALLAWSVQAVSQVHRRRLADRSAPVSTRLHTWEGEGGRPTAVGQAEATPDLTP